MTPEGTWGATQGSEGEKRASHSARFPCGEARLPERQPGLRASGQRAVAVPVFPCPGTGTPASFPGVSTSAPFSLRVAPALAASVFLAACAFVAGQDVAATPADELFNDTRVGDVRVVMDPADLAWRVPLGIVGIVTGVLHFLVPGALLL